MNTLRKRLLIVLGVVVVLSGAGFLILTQGLSAAVKSSVEDIGSQATATPVMVQDVSISLFTGKGEITGFTIDNPDGFNTDYAFELGRIFFHLDMRTLRDSVIVIKEITIDAAQLTAEQKLLRKNNLAALLNSLRAFAETGAERQWPSHFAIEQLNFINVQVTLHAPIISKRTFDLPDVHINDIGRPSIGISVPELPLQTLEPIIAEVLKAVQQRVLGQ